MRVRPESVTIWQLICWTGLKEKFLGKLYGQLVKGEARNRESYAGFNDVSITFFVRLSFNTEIEMDGSCPVNGRLQDSEQSLQGYTRLLRPRGRLKGKWKDSVLGGLRH